MVAQRLTAANARTMVMGSRVQAAPVRGGCVAVVQARVRPRQSIARQMMVPLQPRQAEARRRNAIVVACVRADVPILVARRAARRRAVTVHAPVPVLILVG